MTEIFGLRRVRLINFHNFVDETLPVRKNLFLIGDNQSGKTTVLDAVHFALSAGVDMEFNAAARFGPRNEPGRNLASIALRYDLERDVAQRGPSVMYAALEITGEAGTVHTFGAGAFATSLDAQPDAWGFVARGVGLDEVPLCAEDPDDPTQVRRRPRDRGELENVLGRGAVLDKGRYRTAVAQLLFRDRDAYLRALELLAAGKAYRELVARARNLDDLFIGLLPPPAESEFEEVRSALRAIQGIRSDLSDLEVELDVLRHVIEKLRDARRETEKIARYEFVGAERARRDAEERFQNAGIKAQQAENAATQAKEERTTATNDVARREATLRALRASEGATLLAREEEARGDKEEAARDVARGREELSSRNTERSRALEDAADAEARFESAKDRAGAALRSVAAPTREHLDDEAVAALGVLAATVLSIEPGVGRATVGIERPLATLRGGFEAAREAAAGGAARSAAEAERLRSEATNALVRAEEVRERAEVLPDLPGYQTLLAALQADTDQAVPLYRLFALAPDVQEMTGAGIECLLGSRVLGSIVVPSEQHAAARSRVIAHGAGVEVVDPSELDTNTVTHVSGTLPAALVDAGPEPLTAIGRAFLSRVAGDVRILASGEPRGDAARAVWSDGHIFEQGAESRVDPAAPRFLGAEARARAAAQEEARLRVHAEQLLATAARAQEEAARQRDVAGSCRQSLTLLDASAPSSLLALAATLEGAQVRVEERSAAEREALDRVERATERLMTLQRRHAELAASVTGAGFLDLRDRIERMQADLDGARETERAAIDAAARARQEADGSAADAREDAARLDAAAAGARSRREALLPLVEPRYRADLDDYVFRVMRGQQILAENVLGLVQESSNARARAFQWLESSDGIRNERLWQRYAFRLDEDAREIRDQSGRPVEQVYEERENEVRSLQGTLDERTRDLLERVVMAGLVRRLQGQLRELRDTIQGVNRLAADLRFGTSRFQFSLRQRPEFQRLLDLLREQSILQPTLREELRDFFQARLDELGHARQGEVPEILDYRRWFDYVLQVQSRADGGVQDLPRQRLRFGSTGEQAVPTYLLVIAVASLLYDRTEARLRLLLLDEAFLGIDAGRREVLMQFADRARIDLIVATPELDGVTPALASSSTLFIEKTPEQDVYVSDYQWQRPGLQADLFSEPVKPGEMDLVLGVRPVEASARSKARAPVEPAAVADTEISRRETSDPEDD
jgi:hypothetical protein